MAYVAIVYTPGYLPEDDPVTFDTAAEAWQYLADERRQHEEGFWQALAEDYSATVRELDERARLASESSDEDWTGTVHGDTPGYDGSHDLGVAYSAEIAEMTTP